MEESKGLEILKVDTKGRVRVSRKRREALLAEYDRSSMSAAAFADWSGIKYPTFCWWLQERRRALEKEAKAEPIKLGGGASWVEAIVDEQHEGGRHGSGGRLVIEIGPAAAGVAAARLEVADSGSVALAAELLRHLGGSGRC